MLRCRPSSTSSDLFIRAHAAHGLEIVTTFVADSRRIWRHGRRQRGRERLGKNMSTFRNDLIENTLLIVEAASQPLNKKIRSFFQQPLRHIPAILTFFSLISGHFSVWSSFLASVKAVKKGPESFSPFY